MPTLMYERYGLLSGATLADENSTSDERLDVLLRLAVGYALLVGVERHRSPDGWMDIESWVRCILSVAATRAFRPEACDPVQEAYNIQTLYGFQTSFKAILDQLADKPHLDALICQAESGDLSGWRFLFRQAVTMPGGLQEQMNPSHSGATG